MADLRRWFDTIDRNRSGTLDAKELQAALAMGNLHFSLKAVAHMIRIHDPDRSGTIDFREFQTLHNFLMTMQGSFQHFDKDRSGSLNRQETYQAVTQAGAAHYVLLFRRPGIVWLAGYRLDGPAFEALFKAFDPDQDSQMGMPEYIAMTLVLTSAAKTFQAFDSQRQGRINLNWDQWIYAAANVV